MAHHREQFSVPGRRGLIDKAGFTAPSHRRDMPPLITAVSATAQGLPVNLFTMDNGQLRVVVTDLGARLLLVHVPDRTGELADVVLARASLDDLIGDETFMGATAGRCANRIREGRLAIDGQEHLLTCNEGRNQVHGGTRGFDQYPWTTRQEGDQDAISFSRFSPDGEEGFPGELSTQVRYTLTGRCLDIEITATTDRPTIANVVNHAYFNMAGHASGTVLDQLLQLDASFYTPVNDELLPTGEILSVEGTPFDSRTPTPIGQSMGGPQRSDASDTTTRGAGYDHNWVLAGSGFRLVGSLTDPASGRQLRLWTDQPGVQVYAGGYLEGTSAKRPAGPMPPSQGSLWRPKHSPIRQTSRTSPNECCVRGRRIATAYGTSSRSRALPRPSGCHDWGPPD